MLNGTLAPAPAILVVERNPKQTATIPDPFLIFPCGKCKEQIILQERLEPGQAAVMLCENCGFSWTVVLPGMVVVETAKYEPVWEKLTA
jgi:predicted RNA-binding Zn-ribbon protein involved in translation (DUF1610 family)